MWIPKLKETQKLTQVSVDSVLQDVSELCTVTVGELGTAVKSAIESAGLQFNNIPGLPELFTPSSPFCQPFRGLSTYQQQLTHYKNDLNFVVRDLLNNNSR